MVEVISDVGCPVCRRKRFVFENGEYVCLNCNSKFKEGEI